MELTALIVVVYFAAIFFSLRGRRHDVRSRSLHFLRAFLPNWRFYHAVGHRPTLELRSRNDAGVWQDWQAFVPRARRHAWHFLHNPQVNLLLVEQTLVEHLAGDLGELADEEEAADLVSYQLLLRLAEKLAAGQAPYQFRVRLLHPFEPDGDNPTVLISPVILSVIPPLTLPLPSPITRASGE